jgi:hypothetical protein
MGKSKYEIGDKVGQGTIVAPTEPRSGRFYIKCDTCGEVGLCQPSVAKCNGCWTSRRKVLKTGAALPDGRVIHDVKNNKLLVSCVKCGQKKYKWLAAINKPCRECKYENWGVEKFGRTAEASKKVHSLIGSARKRGHEVSISQEYMVELMSSDCHWCGEKPSIKLNGVDRLDSSAGYIDGNCVASCWYCNRAKSTMSVEEWKSWLSRAYNYSVKNTI